MSISFEKNKSAKPDPAKRWILFSNMAIQMGAIIALMAYAGVWLDEKYLREYPWFTIGFSLLGVFAALYNVYRQLKQITDKESN